MTIDELIIKIQQLTVTHQHVNHWEGVKFKPYRLELIDKTKVIDLLNKFKNITPTS